MNILLVNNGYPTIINPNYTTYIKTIEECIVKADCKVDKLVIKYNSHITRLTKILKYGCFWLRCLSVNCKKYDYIYINHVPHCWPLLFNPTFRKTKAIIHWHGDDLAGRSKFLRFIHKIIKPKINNFDHIVPSRYFKNKLLDTFPISKFIYVSPSGGVDTNLFVPDPKSDNSNQIVIGFASGLTTDKGANLIHELMKHQEYLEAVAGKSIIFKIIRYGSEAEKYISLFNKTGAKIEYIEKMNKEDMPIFYNSLSFLLMPSMRESESLGLVVLEAMSCNIPVLTHDICAFPEFVISEVSGERCPFTNNLNERTDNVIKCVIKILSNLDKYTPRKVIEETYSKQAVIHFYTDLFHSINKLM